MPVQPISNVTVTGCILILIFSKTISTAYSIYLSLRRAFGEFESLGNLRISLCETNVQSEPYLWNLWLKTSLTMEFKAIFCTKYGGHLHLRSGNLFFVMANETWLLKVSLILKNFLYVTITIYDRKNHVAL